MALYDGMTPLSLHLSKLWRSVAQATLPPTSIGVSGGLWTLPIGQRLDVPPLDHMRLIVNLAPLESHCYWSDGRQRRTGVSKVGAIRIAPVEESAHAEVHGRVFRFAQIYIPKSAPTALGAAPLLPGESSAFRDLAFDVVDPLVAALAGNLLSGEHEPAERLYRDQLSLALLSHLTHRYGSRTLPVAAKGRLDPRRLRLAIEYLETCDTTPSIRELSVLVGLSPHHFARSFRLATGLAPHAWLRGMRIERAKRALATTSASVTEIALNCGYSTPSTFTAAFTRIAGRSPSSWRRST